MELGSPFGKALITLKPRKPYRSTKAIKYFICGCLRSGWLRTKTLFISGIWKRSQSGEKLICNRPLLSMTCALSAIWGASAWVTQLRRTKNSSLCLKTTNRLPGMSWAVLAVIPCTTTQPVKWWLALDFTINLRFWRWKMVLTPSTSGNKWRATRQSWPVCLTSETLTSSCPETTRVK